MITNYLVIGNFERPDIKVITYNDQKRTHHHPLNKSQWIPCISTITGLTQAAASLAHTIYHLANYVLSGEGLEEEAKQHLAEAKLGAKCFARGCVVSLPIIGNIIAITYDFWQSQRVKGDKDHLTLFTSGEKIHSRQVPQEAIDQFKTVPFSTLESWAWPKPFCSFTPLKDKSGFVIGGENSTATIRSLTSLNGHSIDLLEKVMYPSSEDNKDYLSHTSSVGFLNHEEKLLDVMAKDNDTVQKYSLTHSQLAYPLFQILKQTNMSSRGTCQFQGQTYQYSDTTSKGWQYSPFLDDTQGTTIITLKKPGTKEELEFTNIGAHMILRYGFYQGNTPYRVEPKNIIKFFNLSPKTSF